MFLVQYLLLFILFFSSVLLVQSGFVITVPSTLTADSDERVCINVHEKKIESINVQLFSELSDNIIVSSSELIKGNASCFTLHIPTTNETKARLTIGLNFLDNNDNDNDNSINKIEKFVEIKQDPLITAVSLEKPFYKPGDVVRFRLLTLTHKLKVHKYKVKKVWIESPNGISLEQWSEFKTLNGFIQLEFSLSEETVLGDWKIKIAYHQSDYVKEKTFIVKEYEMPRFKVLIKQPKEILADAESIDFEVCAKHSYGAPVRGHFKLDLYFVSAFPNVQRPKFVHEGELSNWTGCTVFKVPGSELYLSDPELQVEKLKLTAEVTEVSTEVTETATVSLSVLHSALQLVFHCSSYFKPGLPYKGKVRVLSASGQPTVAVGLQIQICMKEEADRIRTQFKQCWNYTTDYSSEVIFTLPPRPQLTSSITITAVSTEHEGKFYSENDRWTFKMVQPRAVQELKRWYSPSNSYLDVSTVSPVVCNTLHSLRVQYTVKNFTDVTPTFYYLVESRGDLLHTGTMKPDKEKELVDKLAVGFPPARSFPFPLLITHDMPPEARLLVYYVDGEGEIIAGSTILKVDKCFPNKVSAHWSELKVIPGSNVTLSIRADPFSHCATNVIDSVLTKDHLNEVDVSDSIWKTVEQYINPIADDFDINCLPDVNDIIGTSDPDFAGSFRAKRMYALPVMFGFVDAATAFNDAGVIVMTDLMLETRPCFNDRNKSAFNGQRAQSLNSLPEPIVDSKRGMRSSFYEKHTSVREFFPEAWLWNTIDVGQVGESVLQTSVPHSITSWDASVICINDVTGFGYSESHSLVTFLPFFLTVKTPSTFKRLEKVPVTVTLYNYLGHGLPVEIELTASFGIEIFAPIAVTDCISELSPNSYNFTIIAHRFGQLNITTKAVVLQTLNNCSPGVYAGMSDTVVKKLDVKAEGFPISKTYSSLLCNNDNLASPWNVSLPQNVIANTARAQFTVSPEVLGPALKDLGDLIEMPGGCGEQNMVRLAPLINIYHYLTLVNVVGGEKIKNEALNYIKKGYQRQLIYRHLDGSYSAFGLSYCSSVLECSSIWLTAFVIGTFGQASKIIDIDNAMLQETLNWIVSKQMENGCFPMIGEVFNKELKGGLNETDSITALTAYIITSLYKSGLQLPTSVLKNAEFCLSAESTGTDLYSLVLITYAFANLNSSSHITHTNLQRLIKLAKHDQDMYWWENAGSSAALNVEITGYAVLSLSKIGGPNNLAIARGAVRWISLNRNTKGGFISTQDTVIGLEALTAFAMTLPVSSAPSLLISITQIQGDVVLSQTINVNDSNGSLQQQITVKLIPSVLRVSSVGTGCVLVQTKLRYNADSSLLDEAFELTVTSGPLSSIDPCHFQRLEICTSYSISDGASNMAFVLINFPTGYVPSRNSLYQMEGVARWEEIATDNTLIVYLDKVQSVSSCFNFIIEQLYKVNSMNYAVVKVTDFYHPERTKSTNYTIGCEEDNNILI